MDEVRVCLTFMISYFSESMSLDQQGNGPLRSDIDRSGKMSLRPSSTTTHESIMYPYFMEDLL